MRVTRSTRPSTRKGMQRFLWSCMRRGESCGKAIHCDIIFSFMPTSIKKTMPILQYQGVNTRFKFRSMAMRMNKPMLLWLLHHHHNATAHKFHCWAALFFLHEATGLSHDTFCPYPSCECTPRSSVKSGMISIHQLAMSSFFFFTLQFMFYLLPPEIPSRRIVVFLSGQYNMCWQLSYLQQVLQIIPNLQFKMTPNQCNTDQITVCVMSEFSEPDYRLPPNCICRHTMR